VFFYRTRSGVSLTPSGRKLLERARSALKAVGEIEQHTEGRGSREHAIIIGAHPVVASYALPRALRELETTAPEFQISLRHGLSREIQGEIQAGRIDIGVVINPSPAPDLVIRKLADDEIAVWTRAQGETGARVICDPDLFQAQSILRSWKGRPARIVSTPSLELVARLTAEGLGFGIAPARVVKLLNLPLKRLKGAPTYADRICLVHRPEFGRAGFERACANSLTNAFRPGGDA
jgi:DNA-binding transcriptional LysR family regulator